MPGPTLPIGTKIYDAIMEVIEPDLVSTEVERLEEKYKGETPEEKESRMRRYEHAFMLYDRAYASYMQELDEQVKTCRRTAREASEARARREAEYAQEELLTKIENA